jgi:hypothetical protein
MIFKVQASTSDPNKRMKFYIYPESRISVPNRYPDLLCGMILQDIFDIQMPHIQRISGCYALVKNTSTRRGPCRG